MLFSFESFPIKAFAIKPKVEQIKEGERPDLSKCNVSLSSNPIQVLSANEWPCWYLEDTTTSKIVHTDSDLSKKCCLILSI